MTGGEHRTRCPRFDYDRHAVPTYYPERECAWCDIERRRQLVHWMPMLGELYDWLDGCDVSYRTQIALYEWFMDEMPYGVQKFRTGDPDSWLADRPHLVEELIATVEDACIFTVNGT